MSTLAEVLRYQIASAVWADKRMLAAASELTADELNHDFKTSDHSVLATLTHISWAERMWLTRIKGNAPPFQSGADNTMEALKQQWPVVGDDWLDWSDSLTEDVAAAELTYQDLKKNTWTQPLWKVVMHVVNHSTHHRGQVAGFIRALGHQPPTTDSIAYARQIK